MNLTCKIGLATAAIAATLAIACTLPGLSEPEPTRRPTYTAYPTFTPPPSDTEQQAITGPPRPIARAPLKIVTTAPAVLSTTTQTDPTIAPTVDPNTFYEVGDKERFFGLAGTESKTGTTLMRQGDYQAALEAFKRAQGHHGKPSSVLESLTGMAFLLLADHGQAISHFTKAIDIEDNAVDRINRAKSYFEMERCDLAINDAHQALGMTPEYREGSHTDAEAHSILGTCHIVGGDLIRGIFHLKTDLELAEEHRYADDKIVTIHVRIAKAQYSNEQYTETIEHFSKAIALNDTADVRVGRALSYLEIADCTTAIADSHQALALPPVTSPQYHSDAEANMILALCYYQRGELQRALQHADAAQQIMQEHGYPAEYIETLETLEGAIRSAMGL